MNEIARISLENDMDLILVHKQCMRLAELAGLSTSSQTTFATAVSEICRGVLTAGRHGDISLNISGSPEASRNLVAILQDKRTEFSEGSDEGYKYAKRLVSHINAATGPEGTRIELHSKLAVPLHINEELLNKWRLSLNSDPAVSPYEEIKRKNRQLADMANKLRDSEQRIKTLTDSMPIMILSMTPAGEITFANRWLYEYTGKTADDINRDGWTDIKHEGDLGIMQHNMDRLVADANVAITSECRLKHAATGEYRWHTGVMTALKTADGSVTQWNVFMVDIHAQKMVEETLRDNIQLKAIKAELEEKVALLDQSNQQLEQFAYITSHDLQEPLHKIGFYSDLLMKKYGSDIPESAGIYFDNLVKATVRMKTLIQDVLSYSTVRKEQFTNVDLNVIAAEMLQDLEVTIAEKGAEVNVGKLPVILGNARQMKQLFANLVSNSLKFLRPGVLPVIDITAETDGKNVRLSFADNGIGFDEKHTGKLFDLFHRLHARDKYSGTGIGLAICKKIVEMHNGIIAATGTPGAGATFTITMPFINEGQKNSEQ